MTSHHTFDLFGVDVHLVTKPSELAALLTDLTDEPQEWNSLGMVQTYHSGVFGKEAPAFHVVICLSRKVLRKDQALRLRTTAHEATHAAAMILDHLGEECDGGSETLAYLVGWLTDWLWTAST